LFCRPIKYSYTHQRILLVGISKPSNVKRTRIHEAIVKNRTVYPSQYPVHFYPWLRPRS
jgi:hypothetical protein